MMCQMGYERAVDITLDITQRVQSIQVVMSEVSSIAKLLAAQSLLQRVTFSPMVVEDGSKSEVGARRLEEVD